MIISDEETLLHIKICGKPVFPFSNHSNDHIRVFPCVHHEDCRGAICDASLDTSKKTATTWNCILKGNVLKARSNDKKRPVQAIIVTSIHKDMSQKKEKKKDTDIDEPVGVDKKKRKNITWKEGDEETDNMVEKTDRKKKRKDDVKIADKEIEKKDIDEDEEEESIPFKKKKKIENDLVSEVNFNDYALAGGKFTKKELQEHLIKHPTALKPKKGSLRNWSNNGGPCFHCDIDITCGNWRKDDEKVNFLCNSCYWKYKKRNKANRSVSKRVNTKKKNGSNAESKNTVTDDDSSKTKKRGKKRPKKSYPDIVDEEEKEDDISVGNVDDDNIPSNKKGNKNHNTKGKKRKIELENEEEDEKEVPEEEVPEEEEKEQEEPKKKIEKKRSHKKKEINRSDPPSSKITIVIGSDKGKQSAFIKDKKKRRESNEISAAEDDKNLENIAMHMAVTASLQDDTLDKIASDSQPLESAVQSSSTDSN